MSNKKQDAAKDAEQAVNTTEENAGADKMDYTGGAAEQINTGDQPNPENSNMPVAPPESDDSYNKYMSREVLEMRDQYMADLKQAKERAIQEAIERHYENGGGVGLPRWKIGTGEDHLYIGNDRVITLINYPSFDITVRKEDEDDEAYYRRLIANNVY